MITNTISTIYRITPTDYKPDMATYQLFYGKIESKWMMNESDIQRFWSKAKNTGDCIEWTARMEPAGYGYFTIRRDGKTLQNKAHIFSYSTFKGPIEKGLFVRHICNNKKCVNPIHLETGTHQDNMDDLSKSGIVNGEKNHRAKLTDEQADEIRRLYATGNYSYPKLAAVYMVSDRTIAKIIKNKSYKNSSLIMQVLSTNHNN